MPSQTKFSVYEHQSLRIGDSNDENKNIFSDEILKTLQEFYGQKGVPYFSLIHNGVLFNEYVGVVQFGNTIIEVLPKADDNDSKESWRDVLIGMLKAVGSFKLEATSNSNLNLRPNSILELYFEIFIGEVEYLLHNGLIKQYRKKKGNVNSLKGNLLFSQNIQQNLTHKERFFVRHTVYDVEHKFHQILYKTILLLNQINTNSKLQSRIGALLLNFPEMEGIKVTESTFEKIIYNRKNSSYKNALEISKLLLLNYHPDLKNGRNHVLALMFDMNLLWEQFVYVSLRKNRSSDTTVKAQFQKPFWKQDDGNKSSMKPDIVLSKDGKTVVIDTKWKNLNGKNPSPEDLRQMYVYYQYFDAKKVALVYPGKKKVERGYFLDRKSGENTEIECSTITISTKYNITDWQIEIYNQIIDWAKNSNG